MSESCEEGTALRIPEVDLLAEADGRESRCSSAAPPVVARIDLAALISRA